MNLLDSIGQVDFSVLLTGYSDQPLVCKLSEPCRNLSELAHLALKMD